MLFAGDTQFRPRAVLWRHVTCDSGVQILEALGLAVSMEKKPVYPEVQPGLRLQVRVNPCTHILHLETPAPVPGVLNLP